MIYGLYLSATGVLANTYRQDVIANNLANVETVGFKKDLALFTERPTASNELGQLNSGDPLSTLTGGMWAAPTYVDTSQGPLQETGNSTDMAIEGKGFFMVQTPNGNRLTRDGRFLLDNAGNLVMANNVNAKVLDNSGKPISLDARQQIALTKTGEISQSGRNVAQIGIYEVDKPADLHKLGANLLSYDDNMTPAPATDYTLHQKFVERSNVEPAVELTRLMDAERQLEVNASMIKTQDATLGELVNTVEKIS
ncbi:MAG TPA: flagellar hook-basal body protein [Tepidisphaeraceae bacterium]|nr:flagellar hook-basal body protein [Tepidisphaeraceae bacterium]